MNDFNLKPVLKSIKCTKKLLALDLSYNYLTNKSLGII